ncbi:unnamed protein product [Orchesella dallaii]|uniref:C2H2-type domain-containing protein n=1 Tax=Orchesella dallaii TaxID=48710 RepID=A0ABP1S9H5_9HEXA
MAATVSHQHQLHFTQENHHHQQQQPSSPPSPPKSTSSTSSSSSSSSASSPFLHGGELVHSSGHYCADCGVMFESSTSLEVHISYHKENLLTRWANQDSSSSSEKSVGVVVSHPSSSPHNSTNSNNSSSSSSSSEPDMSTSGSSTNSHPPTPHSIDGSSSNAGNNGGSGSNGSGASAQQQQRFFPNSNEFGNNNPNEEQPSQQQQQQQHSMDHPYRQGMNSNGQFGGPPVDLNNHINGNIPHHHSPYHSPIMIAQNHMFSPNHSVLPPNNHHSQQQPPPPPPGGDPHNRGGPPSNTESGTAAAIRESAEILDLDSHKVHVYQPPLSDRHFFHSPYGLPPMFGNGWPHGIPPEHQFVPHGHHPPPPPPFGGDHHHHHGIPPYTMHGQSAPSQLPPHSTHVYELAPPIDRGNPQFSSEPPPPPLDYPPQPPQHQQAPPPSSLPLPPSAQNQGGPPPFGQPNGGVGFTPMAAQPADNRQERISLSSPLAPSPAQKSPNEASTPANHAGSAAAAKTKGWKGGECKRPKTYNCTACNKWFTSSGHLKRHYGTTLHKNSIKQKDLPDEPPPPPKRGKNGVSKQSSNNNNTSDVIRDRSPMKDFGLKGSLNEGSNGRSGYVPSPPIIQNSPAPPKISPQQRGQQQQQVDDMMMDKPLHKGPPPPGHMIGSSPAFNIPSGFKSSPYDSPQALNADNNSSIEHHHNNPPPGYLSQPPQSQRLFNPAMGHHQFYQMSHAHPPPPFMNGFGSDPAGLQQNGPPPPSSQYVG